jgi:chemotaxis protein methyltransferase CheR
METDRRASLDFRPVVPDLTAAAAPPPSDREFALFQKLIREEAGISLGPAKKDLLVARLQKRLRALGVPSFRAYYARVVDDADERDRMLDCIATNETRFFREPQQLAFLSQRVLPRLLSAAAGGLRGRSLRVWSAGCATGEEAYTLAMLVDEQQQPEGWSIEVLATDLSRRAVERAEDGCYQVSRVTEIPAAYLKRYMLRGVRSREGWMSVSPGLRSLVRFQRLNLCGDPYPQGPFDVVCCRNVLIYFDSSTRDQVVAKMVDRLGSNGLLLLGHAESLTGSRHGLRLAGPLTWGRPTEGAWW